MKKNVTGIAIILVSTMALGLCGYFFYKYYKDGAPDEGLENNHIELPMDMDIPNYKPMANPNIPKAVPNNDPSSYRILDNKDLNFTYQSIAESSTLEGMIPAKGQPNIFLVPVQFDDLARRDGLVWDEQKLTSLNGAFNGTKEDTTNEYAESVRSFYRKSSYGQLDLNFVLTDPLQPSLNSDLFVQYESSTPDGKGTYKILEDFYKYGSIHGKKINFHDPKYDINGDGYVDGVWLIYNETRLDMATAKYRKRYWPYCYWYVSEDYNGPNFSAYANCSANFMYVDSFQGLDYHTITHETGHMLGLDDYYSYDPGVRNAAIGGLDMMDFNIGEHNSFSKTAIGWTNPIIPLKPGEFTLRPFEETGDCIILSNDFNDSAFSEYIILEYYTPTGLNEFDARKAYDTRNRYFTQSGIRAFHVDARLVEVKAELDTGASIPQDYIPSSKTKLPTLSRLNPYYYVVGHSNTRSRNLLSDKYSNSNEDLIGVISQDNKTIYNRYEATNNSLFQLGDKFEPYKYRKYFQNSTFTTCNFNDESRNNFEFEVAEMNPREAKLKINF